MSDPNLVYRALMPDHYLPRANGLVQEVSLDGSRKWVATRLPQLRVFGPLWSFGLVVADLERGATQPDGTAAGARLFDLRTLSAGSSRENAPLKAQHPPQLFTARIESVLQTEWTKEKKPEDRFAESRISTLALDTIPTQLVSEDGEIIKTLPPGTLPVERGDEPVGARPMVVLLPFGDPFAKPGEEPTDGANPTGSPAPYLPAMRLVHGRIRLRSSDTFLATARAHLGLDKPAAVAVGGTGLVLLEDGFAIRGKLKLPWHEEVLEGWFRAGFDGEGAGAEPALTPWFDPDANTRAERRAWDAALDALGALVAAAQSDKTRPAWLDLEVADRIAPEDLTLPLAFRSGKPDSDRLNAPITVHRPDKSVFAIGGRALRVRMADRPQSRQPRATLTIEPRRFLLTKAGKSLVISAEVKGSEAKAGQGDDAVATYSFTAEGESLSLAGETGGAPLALAVPLAETAAALRNAMGLPAPDAEEKQNAWLWGFSPVEGGWLHWPLPNVTPHMLPRPDQDNAVPNDPADGISGALLFGNFRDAPDRRADQVNWSLSLAEPRQVTLRVVLSPGEKRISEAEVTLGDPSVALDGVVPLVPFRQTGERLLPDQRERALTVRSLTGQSPRRLPPGERAAWRKGTDRLELALHGGRIEAKEGGLNTLTAAGGMTVRARQSATLGPAPWLWTRHATLPTVQTLPQAACGGAQGEPSEDRSLAPLRFRTAPDRFHFALNTARSDLRLWRADGTAAPWLGPDALERPPGYPALSELGMAVTTMPSVTLQPGVRAVDGWSGTAWNALASARLKLRHDIALGDEANAFAVPPPPPEPTQAGATTTDDPPPAEARFAPQPDNGPGLAGEVAAAVWAGLERKAALAALDQRDMVVGTAADADKATLTGFWHADATGTLDFDPSVAVDIDGATLALRSVASVGAWHFDVAGGGKLDFAGLPSTAEAEGLSGAVAFGGSEIDFDLGSPVRPAADTPFADQTGLVHGLVKDVNLGGRQAQFTMDGETRLLTLRDPVAVKGEEDLAFWCADVPVDQGGAGKPIEAANGADIGKTLRTGFRWALGWPGRASAVVNIAGFSFAPLALAQARIDANDNLTGVDILGRLVLPLDKADPRDDAPAGSATLTLKVDGAALEARITASDIVWPLAPAGRLTAPRLQIRALPSPGGTEPATLAVTLGGVRWDVPVTVSRRAEGETEKPLLSASLVAQGTAVATTTQASTLTVTGLDLRIMPGEVPVARLTWALVARDGALTLRGNLEQDLLGDSGPQAIGVWTLSEWRSGRPIVTTERLAAEVTLGNGALALAATLPADTAAPLGGLFDPLTPAEGTLSLLAGITAVAGSAVIPGKGAVAGVPSFRLDGPRLGARLPLVVEAQNRTLLLATDTGDNGVRCLTLSGALTLANAFSWPRLDVRTQGEFERAEVPVKAAARITHSADVRFDRATLTVDTSGRIEVPATVRHRLADGQDHTVEWQAHHRLRIWPAGAFKAVLEARRPPSITTSGALEKLPVGFSPIGPRGPQTWSEYSAAPHYLHVSAADPGGVSGPLAKALATAIGERRFLAVDLSGHHVLFASSESEGHLVSLPAVGFIGRNAGEVLAADKVKPKLETTPPEPLKVAQHLIDGAAGRRVPRLSGAQGKALAQASAETVFRSVRKGVSRAEAALEVMGEAEDVFQTVAMIEVRPLVWTTAGEWPGVGPAMQLSSLFTALPGQTRPLALRLATPPYLTSRDLRPDGGIANPTDVILRRFLELTAQVRERAARVLLPGPDAADRDGGISAAGARLRLLAPAWRGGEVRVLADLDLTAFAEVTLGKAEQDWARAALERLAPDAACGLVENTASGAVAVVLGRGAAARGGALSLPLRGDTAAPVRQRQALQAPVSMQAMGLDGALVGRLRDGLRPFAVRPERMRSEQPTDEYDTEDAQLTSSALTVSMQLGASDSVREGAVLAPGPDLNFWISDRQSVAFRPAAPADEGQPMTFALPSDFAARLPAPVVPVRPEAVPGDVIPPETDRPLQDTYQSFLPPRGLTSILAGRPGAMTIRRSGVLVRSKAADPSEGPWLAVASDVPLHARLPRLPRLGQADRPRGSAVEPLAPRPSRLPTAIVYGPPDDATPPAEALRLELEHPAAAVLTQGWDGQVRLRAVAVAGDIDGNWTVEAVRLSTVAGDVLPQGAARSATVSTTAPLWLDLTQARRALLDLAPASEARLTLTLLHEDRRTRRMAVFSLLTAAAGRIDLGLETPVFLRFEDPEYAAALTGVPRVARTISPFTTTPQEDLILAVELSSARPDQRVTLMVALRPKSGDSAGADQPGTRINQLALRLERQRPGSQTAEPLILTDPAGSSLDPADQGVHPFAGISPKTAEAVVALDLGLVRRPQTEDGLRAGDRLILQVVPRTAGLPVDLPPLFVDIVATPVLPANGSSFALLALTHAEASADEAPPAVRVVLYAHRPAATLIELVDPEDLLRGRIRRRATYQWRAFLAPEPGRKRLVALQKIGQTTATWLPDTVENGWSEI